MHGLPSKRPLSGVVSGHRDEDKDERESREFSLLKHLAHRDSGCVSQMPSYPLHYFLTRAHRAPKVNVVHHIESQGSIWE